MKRMGRDNHFMIAKGIGGQQREGIHPLGRSILGRL
jgi:hypothetical protein